MIHNKTRFYCFYLIEIPRITILISFIRQHVKRIYGNIYIYGDSNITHERMWKSFKLKSGASKQRKNLYNNQYFPLFPLFSS